MTQTPRTPARPAPRPRRAAPRHRGRNVLLAVSILLVLVLGALAVYAFTLSNRLTQNITRGVDLPQSSETPRPETGTLNYVLLGSDSRDPDNEANGRSDSIMVVHLNTKRTKAYITSFPRDMYVDIPGHGQNKINAAYAIGGAPLTVRTLENLLDVRMDHVMLIDFEGFVQLTDDLDGVTVTNETAFTSHGHDYPKGKISIKGSKAMWFVRERHALPRGDLDRAENQRKVLKAIVQKGLSAGVVSDPATFTRFIGNVAKNVTVDNSLSDEEIRRTALSLRLTGEDITLLQAPISGNGTSPDGQSILEVNTAQLAELSTALKNDKLGEYVKKYPES
jgi:polyisoprenyl-teichoic acid--peptidoglycan teichoic acid transferase